VYARSFGVRVSRVVGCVAAAGVEVRRCGRLLRAGARCSSQGV
jgi:hypothetical protein